MDVSHPIRGIIPTLDAPVIEALARTTRGLSGREVHRLAGMGSVRGVQLVLARLVAQGLVRAEEHPGVTLYTANRDHVAWPALETLVGIPNALMELLRSEIASWPIEPVHVSLFGSIARRDGDARSDIDLLVIRPDASTVTRETWDSQVDGLRDAVVRWTGNRCQIFEVDRSRLREHVLADDPLVANWLHDAVTLAGPGLAGLVAGLALPRAP